MTQALTYRRGRGLAAIFRSTIALLLAACVSDGPNGPGAPPANIASPDELRDLVTALAHDSLKGRRAGSSEEHIVTQYVATRVQEFGLVPAAGAGSSFFHDVPATWRSVSGGSADVDGVPIALWNDFVPTLPRTSTPTMSWDAQAVYGGTFTATTMAMPSNVDITGRAVVMQSAGPLLVSLAPDNDLAKAAVVLLVGTLSPDLVAFGQTQRLLAGAAYRNTQGAPLVLAVTNAVAERIMGGPLVGMPIGQAGARTRGTISVATEAASMRNVVAVVSGSDAALAGEYVALGAHLDHIGVRQGAGATDSIFNGADDNASGSAALLVLARHYASSAHRPRRSLVFIWFAAEELGLIGSEAFTFAPTVPLASMSAFINLDMISRGGVGDIEGGGPAYLESIGSRRGSTQLAPIVDSVAIAHGMQLNYSLDAPGHPERVFCRSDQWNFARFAVPVVFFSTGLHGEYHGVDDEADRSDYMKLARVTTMVGGLVDALSSRPAGIARDLPAPIPGAVCQQ